jgi:hypothetical protein
MGRNEGTIVGICGEASSNDRCVLDNGNVGAE